MQVWLKLKSSRAHVDRQKHFGDIYRRDPRHRSCRSIHRRQHRRLRSELGWQSLLYYAPVGKVVSLRANANGLYVSAANTSTLIANRTNAGPSEQFKVVDM